MTSRGDFRAPAIEALRYQLAAQERIGETLDRSAISLLGVASTVLAIAFGLLGTSDVSLEWWAKTPLCIGGASFLGVVIGNLLLFAFPTEIEMRADPEILGQAAMSGSRGVVEQFLIQEYEAAIDINKNMLIGASRRVAAIQVFTLLEAFSLAVAGLLLIVIAS